MSMFLNNPDFEGDYEFKELVDNMFKVQKTEKEEPKPKKIKFPEPQKLEPVEEEAAILLAQDEMETVREAFLDFQDAIANTALYPYLFPEFEEMGESFKEMVELVEDSIDQSELTEAGKKDYERMLKVRNRILSSVYNFYKTKE